MDLGSDRIQVEPNNQVEPSPFQVMLVFKDDRLHDQSSPNPSFKGQRLVLLFQPPIFIELAQLNYNNSNSRTSQHLDYFHVLMLTILPTYTRQLMSSLRTSQLPQNTNNNYFKHFIECLGDMKENSKFKHKYDKLGIQKITWPSQGPITTKGNKFECN